MDMSFLYGACGGGVVGVLMVIFGCFVYTYFKRVLAERDRLLVEQSAARDKRITDVSDKLDKHIAEDNPKALSVKLDAIEKSINECIGLQRGTDQNMGRLSREVGEIRTSLDSGMKANEKWMGNMDTSVQKHITDWSIHHHGN